MKKILIALFLLIATLTFANPLLGSWEVFAVEFNKEKSAWQESPISIIVHFENDFTFYSYSTQPGGEKFDGTYSLHKNVIVYSYNSEDGVDPSSGIRYFNSMQDGSLLVKSLFWITLSRTSKQILDILDMAGISRTLPRLFAQVWGIYDQATDSDTQVLRKIKIKNTI